jgi:ATP-dependent helicase/nuclease subunit A
MAEYTPAQARAIAALDTNVAVSAGAGAGKTKVLVERYLGILTSGRAACDEILAITFTNKAAKEMKERIRARTAELATAADHEEARRWREVADALERAPIGTFHSFCARVLRENPVEAALDPGFAVLDEVEADLLSEKALAEVIASGLDSGAHWLDTLLTAYDTAALTAAVPDLYEKLAAAGLLEGGLVDYLCRPYRQSVAGAPAVKQELVVLCDELIAFQPNLDPKGAQYARVARLAAGRAEALAAVEAADSDEAADAVLDQYFGRMDKRSKDKAIVGEIKEKLRQLRLIKADRTALAIMPSLAELFLALHASLARHKAEQRALTFTDLELRAATLLRGSPTVCRRYQTRLRHIMVDEFQDTNDLQRQIVYLVAGGDADRLRGDKLFIVGDAKQSIYRFRGADVAVFERVRKDIAAGGGELIELDVNFRSLDGLLDLYNECFATVMTTADDTIPFSALRAFRCCPQSARTRAEFITVGKQRSGEAPPARAAEAQAVARRIAAMVGGREALIGSDDIARPVDYGDIAILFRTTTDIDTYAAALQTAGIPYYIVGGKGFYHCQEISDILGLLQVVENHHNETALAGALRSPLFLLADAALVALKNHGGSLWTGLADYRGAGLAAADEAAAARAWRIIGSLRSLRGYTPISRLIRQALVETGYASFVLSQFMGRQKYANLQKLAAVAETFEERGSVTLGDFLRYVARLVAGEVKEGEAQIESEDSDTVKLMTIHRSKGLEFPVVFIPDLHRKFNDDSGSFLFSPQAGLGVKVPTAGGDLTATTCHEAVAAAEKRLAMLELKRVLYVAFTRARDYLVLSAAGDKVAADKEFSQLSTWLGWLGKIYRFSAIDELPPELMVDKAVIAVRPAAEVAPAAATAPAADITARQPDDAFLAALTGRINPLAAARPLPVFQASSIGDYRKCPRSFYYKFIAGLPEASRQPAVGAAAASGPPARLLGTLLHRCLELMTPAVAVDDCLARALAETVPTHWHGELGRRGRRLLARYAGGEFYRELAARPARKEWRFNFYLSDPDTGETYTFDGQIDCLVEYGDGSLGVVDYKTDKVTAAEAPARAAEYAPQLALYTLAAAAAWNRPVRDARFYFLRPDLAVPLPVDDVAVAAYRRDLLAVCRQVAAHGDEAAYHFDTSWCHRCGYRYLCPGSR